METFVNPPRINKNLAIVLFIVNILVPGESPLNWGYRGEREKRATAGNEMMAETLPAHIMSAALHENQYFRPAFPEFGLAFPPPLPRQA